MRDTSIEAYYSLVKVNQKQKMVLDTIKQIYPCTDQDIATKLDWPINRVTPRRGELEKLSLIESKGKQLTSSGRRAHAWQPIFHKPQQISLF